MNPCEYSLNDVNIFGRGGPAAHPVGLGTVMGGAGGNPFLDLCDLFSISIALFSETLSGLQGPKMGAELASLPPLPRLTKACETVGVLKMRVPYTPATTALGMYLQETLTRAQRNLQGMLVAARLVIARK